MKTALLIIVEHPDGTSADGLINDGIKSVLNDINADLEEGWALKKPDSPSLEKIQELALTIALRYHLSDFNGDQPATKTFEGIGEDQDIVVWEPFENWDTYEVSDSVWNLANDIETTFTEVFGLEESE